MKTANKIQEKKELFDLPYHRDQLEYWGPFNHSFSDSFLTMGHSFLYQYFESLNNKVLKAIFSSFVEMVQNVSEYNEEAFTDNLPQSFIALRDEEDGIRIITSNLILEKDLAGVKTIFEQNSAIPEEDLEKEYKSKLMSNGSLGLIMLRKHKNSIFEFDFVKNPEGENWLNLELKINYGNT